VEPQKLFLPSWADKVCMQIGVSVHLLYMIVGKAYKVVGWFPSCWTCTFSL